jgi:hypothetical protein
MKTAEAMAIRTINANRNILGIIASPWWSAIPAA